MFIQKLFSKDNRAAWVFIDLIIVIIGVYCAFLIQSYAEDAKNRREQDKVLTALKFEMEILRFRMFETSLGMTNKANELKRSQESLTYQPFSNYRFIEPQYDYQTIQYALNLQNTDIVDFELYNDLQRMFVEVKKIEHVERLLTETSRRYKSIPNTFKKASSEYQLLWAENYDNFQRFVTLIEDRANISARLQQASQDALPIVNNRLGEKKTKEIERRILIENADKIPNENQAVALAKKFFPNFSEQEIRGIYKDIQSNP